jgi:hypothetical protein
MFIREKYLTLTLECPCIICSLDKNGLCNDKSVSQDKALKIGNIDYTQAVSSEIPICQSLTYVLSQRIECLVRVVSQRVEIQNIQRVFLVLPTYSTILQCRIFHSFMDSG